MPVQSYPTVSIDGTNGGGNTPVLNFFSGEVPLPIGQLTVVNETGVSANYIDLGVGPPGPRLSRGVNLVINITALSGVVYFYVETSNDLLTWNLNATCETGPVRLATT